MNPVLRRIGSLLGTSPFLVVEDGPAAGLLISLDRASTDYSTGANEPEVQAALVEHLHPGDVFYDVGANVGFFSLLAARIVGRNGRVVAFEPVPEAARAAQRNLERNDGECSEVLEVAVGAAPGTGSLAIVDHPGGASLLPSPAPDPVRTRIEVEVVALDELVRRDRIPPPDVVKIDVEGTELEVLEGMAGLLDRHAPAVVCEVDAPDDEALAAASSRVTANLASHGYPAPVSVPGYPDASWRVAHVVAARER